VLEHGAAHGLAPLDVALEERALAEAKALAHELLAIERTSQQRREPPRGDRVALEEITEGAGVKQEPAVAVEAVAPRAWPQGTALPFELALRDHVGDELVEDRVERGVGA